ncbi:phosphosugar isomerase [Deinococcus sp. KSM4-11]|uniref:SIS domain-containing protein n=1 Tax=Deinococcus sp. KSM4-11 TaxID=2568654 RepID=UPI0010A3DD4C|nr:SIS domain-containing protein [Deinococcus sp. KSM4-11]THF85897.1 phosphosugar isomerase [Deinococcus sp. KSM4-11]
MTAQASTLLTLLETLSGSYAGPTKIESGPYGLVGTGEGTLAAHLAQTLVPGVLARSGTQFVLGSPDARSAATDYADLAEVAGASVRHASTGGAPGEIDVLVPGGPLATYHFAQYLAYASGHADEAQAADALIASLAARCAPHIEEGNPARDLAWSLWGRQPLLLAAPDAEALPHAWQQLLARVGKTLAIPLLGDPLPLTTGAFEALHEKGDAKVALVLGDLDDPLRLTSEILTTRIDEVIHVEYPDGAQGYAGQLGLWCFGVWVAAYLAERYGTSPADLAVLARAQAVLAGEDTGDDETRLSAPRDDLRRTALGAGWEGDEPGFDVDDLDDADDED